MGLKAVSYWGSYKLLSTTEDAIIGLVFLPFFKKDSNVKVLTVLGKCPIFLPALGN